MVRWNKAYIKGTEEIVGIDDDRFAKVEYVCMACGTDMIARRGKTRVHHFAHKEKTAKCNPESYFHKLGKEIFKAIYDESLEYIVIPSGKRTDLKHEYGDCLIEDRQGKKILKQNADLCIKHKDDEDKDIIVEILFTHQVTKEKIDSTTLENYSINDLISPELCKNQKLKAILENTFLDGLMYINAYTSSAHFHVRNMIVVETEFLETLPDLIPELKNQNFNTLFNGRNIVEVRYILEQMKVLPKNSELETTVNNYFILRNIRSRFIESIICMLIIHNKDEYTKERVRILKKVSGIYIDIEKYLKVDTKKMILKNEDN